MKNSTSKEALLPKDCLKCREESVNIEKNHGSKIFISLSIDSQMEILQFLDTAKL